MSRNCFFPSWPALLIFFLGAGCLMALETPPPAGVDDQLEAAAALRAGNEALAAPEQAERAAAMLRELLPKLPRFQATAQEARILLCKIRYRHPEMGPAPGAGEPVQIEDGVSKPAGLSQAQSQYPAEMRARKAQGKAVIQMVIDREGCVVKTETLFADYPELGQAALEAVATWVFAPAIRGGVPVDVYYTTTVSFRIQ